VPIELVTGPANAGKAQVVLEALRAHLARGGEPLLVVPTSADQARYRRELAGTASATFGVRVERFEGLLAEVARCAGRRETPIGALARECALAALAARSLGTGDVAPSGIASALGELISELEVARIEPHRLRDAVAKLPHDGGQLRRLAEVFAAYRALLERSGRTDRELRAVQALDDLRRKPALWGERPVLLYGFDSFTELELDTIETLGGPVDAPVTVSLTYEPGRVALADRATAFERLRPLARSLRELPARADYYASSSRSALHHLERSLFEDPPARMPPSPARAPTIPVGAREDTASVSAGAGAPACVSPGEALGLLEGASPRAELELVAGEVRALLDEGMRAEEIAIVHRQPHAIAGSLVEVLEDFDIPHAVREPACFVQTALGQALIGLMRCAAGGGELGDLLGWLRAPGVLELPELADLLEERALRRNLLDSEGARALWEADRWPLERIERLRAAADAGPGRLIEQLLVELEHLFCAPRQRAAAVLAERELLEARALSAACRALEELRELVDREPQLAPSTGELAAMLSRLPVDGGKPTGVHTEQSIAVGEDTGAPGRQPPAASEPPSGGVCLFSPLSLRARRVKALFLCGLQEGVFPATAAPESLLGEEDRRELALASGLVLARTREQLAAERYLLYALCSRPEQRLVLSWHTADEAGKPCRPSLFLDDVCDLFASELREGVRRRAAGALSWPGPGAPVGRAGVRAASALHGGEGREAAISALHEPAALAELSGRVLWSASGLEAWTACPVRWLVERMLRAEPLAAEPEPLSRGALAHAVLRDTLDRLRAGTGSARIVPSSLTAAKRLMAQALDEQAERHLHAIPPEHRPAVKRRLQVDLERYLDHAASAVAKNGAAVENGAVGEVGAAAGISTAAGEALEPTYLELEFGFGGELPPLALGEGVSLRGRIDRVDLSADGEALLYDYKGRSATPGARWASDGALQLGLYMTAVEQLLHRPVAGGFYQPLAGRDIRPRGLLDADSSLQIDCVRTDRRTRAEVQEMLEQCRKAALAAAAEARAGRLEPRPATCAPNGVCAYPEICRCQS
jgi:RecB family exonuclease